MSESYYFWLYNWDHTRFPATAYANRSVSCKVTKQAIEIFDDPSIVIDLENVANCELVLPPMVKHYYIASYVKLTLKIGVNNLQLTEENALYLVAMEPLDITFGQSYEETRLLFQVIKDLLEHKVVTIQANLYQRAFERAEKTEFFSKADWNPTVSPKEYAKRPFIQHIHAINARSKFYPALIIVSVFIVSLGLWFWSQAEWDGLVCLAGMMLILIAMMGWLTHQVNQTKPNS